MSQTATPPQSNEKQRPSAPVRSESEMSTPDEDPGYQSRSRSQSRRRRRQTQRQRQSSQQQLQQQDQGGAQKSQKQNLPSVQEQDEPPQQQPSSMQPFEYIGPDSTSMDGPVTYARAMRGEIPMRQGNPNQALGTGQNPDAQAGGKSLMDEEGLKLKLELNLDIEIELKARIHGDLTLALL